MSCSTHPQWPHSSEDCPFCSSTEKELNLTLAEALLLRDYFMKAGYITYEVDGLHEVINKIIQYADSEEKK